ncbi:hypothetical protein EWM57_20545 [Hymenobacter persicinus]|uniref:Uncharacterized protein n=1 Tax=Hymenobacter persicinus TaxID=2025506 RepID=A0A4Q5L7U2_9BACT|nr:hypothetical protein EWM57_20545 [Hymenobacter persicinus]
MPKPETIIACPQCNWMPTGFEQDWQCTCGYTWHTFATGGQCPSCRHQWQTTQCLACSCSSPHSAWYRTTPVQWYHQISPN